jgi:hypothetical protein
MKLQYYTDIMEELQRAPLKGPIHIAGGAIRDTILKRPIRDIDLFLPNVSLDEAAALLRDKFGYVKIRKWTRYKNFSDPSVVRVAKLQRADTTIPISLIGLAQGLDARANIARFDWGVCMASWDGGSFFVMDDRFKRDADNETFTLCRADSLAQFNNSMERYEKLTADRYMGWPRSIPGRFAELAIQYNLQQSKLRGKS